jgi:hypothetical protein
MANITERGCARQSITEVTSVQRFNIAFGPAPNQTLLSALMWGNCELPVHYKTKPVVANAYSVRSRAGGALRK